MNDLDNLLNFPLPTISSGRSTALEIVDSNQLLQNSIGQITATITAQVTAKIEIKFSDPSSFPVKLAVAEAATQNLWHIKKYCDAYIAHLHGATTEIEFEQEAKTFVREKNIISDEQIHAFSQYIKSLLPDADIDDLSMILNVDFERMVETLSLSGG